MFLARLKPPASRSKSSRRLRTDAVQRFEAHQALPRIVESVRLACAEDGVYLVHRKAPGTEDVPQAVEQERLDVAGDIVLVLLQSIADASHGLAGPFPEAGTPALGRIPEIQQHGDRPLPRSPQRVGIAASRRLHADPEVRGEAIQLVGEGDRREDASGPALDSARGCRSLVARERMVVPTDSLGDVAGNVSLLLEVDATDRTLQLRELADHQRRQVGLGQLRGLDGLLPLIGVQNTPPPSR